MVTITFGLWLNQASIAYTIGDYHDKKGFYGIWHNTIGNHHTMESAVAKNLLVNIWLTHSFFLIKHGLKQPLGFYQTW
jgi:hypothetical protein